MTKKETLAATIWLYRGDHRLVIHHQTLEDEEPAFKWDDLPRDVFASILSWLGPAELLTRVQYVSRLWRDVCRDPLMWRRLCIGDPDDVIYKYNYVLDRDRDEYLCPEDDESLRRRVDSRMRKLRRGLRPQQYGISRCLGRVCRLAVDRSLGSLESITIHEAATDNLLHYVADRSRCLKHFRLISCECYNYSRLTKEGIISVAAKVPFLEELEFSHCNIPEEVIEAFARCCPLLVSFKFVSWWTRIGEVCHVIAHQMPRLVHLQLGGDLANDELQDILDGCPCLESLDLYNCSGIDLDGELGLRCERIKEFWYPYDPADEEDYEDYEVCPDDECEECCCSGCRDSPPSWYSDLESDDGYYYSQDYDCYDDIYLN